MQAVTPSAPLSPKERYEWPVTAHTMVSALRRKSLQKALPPPASSLWVNDRPRYGCIGEERLRAGLDWEEKALMRVIFKQQYGLIW